MFKLSDRDLEVAIIKMLQQAIMDMFETNEKQKVLANKQKISAKKQNI